MRAGRRWTAQDREILRRDEELAARHLVFSVWWLLALALDAVAIPAQVLTGRPPGAGDIGLTRVRTRRAVQRGTAGGTAHHRPGSPPSATGGW